MLSLVNSTEVAPSMLCLNQCAAAKLNDGSWETNRY